MASDTKPLPIGVEVLPNGVAPLPDGVTKSLPNGVNTKAIKHITKAKTKAVGGFSKDSFETYQQSLRERFPELDFDLELEKFNLYWYGGARRVKNPKLALLNWMDRARQFLKENQRYGTGINQKYPSQGMAANGAAPGGYPEHDLESWNRDSHVSDLPGRRLGLSRQTGWQCGLSSSQALPVYGSSRPAEKTGPIFEIL
jgi:hypothetical protein